MLQAIDQTKELVIPDNKFLQVYDDHINIDRSIALMRVSYYMDRIGDLPGFDGWSPRWYIPSEELIFSKTNEIGYFNVIILDTAQEIKVGFGYDWVPVVLGPGEIQMQEFMVNLMGYQIGDEILVPLDFSSYLGDSAVMKLFAIMIAQIDDAYVDFSKAMVTYIDLDLPLSMFGITPDLLQVELQYKLKATYKRTNGKFRVAFTNSALIDCHHIFGSFI